MKKYNSPKIEVIEASSMTILAGSIDISTTPVDPSTALSKGFDNIISDDEDEE